MVGFCTGFGRILQMLVNAKTISTQRRKGAETQTLEGGEETRWGGAASGGVAAIPRLGVRLRLRPQGGALFMRLL